MNSKALLVSCVFLAACGNMPGSDETENNTPTTVNAYCTVQLEPEVVDLPGLAELEADDETEVLNISEIEPGKYEVTVCTFDFLEVGDVNIETNA